MEKPENPIKPPYVHEESKKIALYETDAYRERTYEMTRSQQADRLAETRLKSVAMAFDIYKQEPGTFDLNDVFTLADRFVEYAREGNQPQDGTTGRFHGK